ncbi:MAG: septum formation initiator family protein [Kiritimatiellia bacterium]
MNFWLTLYRAASVAFAILAVVAIVCAFLPKFRQNQERQRRINALEAENPQKEEAVKNLRKQQDMFATDVKYVEKVAREELGKAKAGETVYRVGARKPHDHQPRRK